jgi:hypothetical protein
MSSVRAPPEHPDLVVTCPGYLADRQDAHLASGCQAERYLHLGGRFLQSVSSREECPDVHAHCPPHGFLECALGHRDRLAGPTLRPLAKPRILLARHRQALGFIHLDQDIRSLPVLGGQPDVACH